MDRILRSFYLFSVIFLVHGHSCEEGEKCPENLPYCTPAGCVFKCPEGVFTNGSNCVQDCGNQYIFNSTCVPNCPVKYELIEKHINFKFIPLIPLIFCRSKCGEKYFAYNNTCIRACPKESKFVDDGKCAAKCTTSKPLHRNITAENRLVGIECRKTCDESSTFPFQNGNECVPKCGEDQVVFQGKCLADCPKNAGISITLEECLRLQLGPCQQDWPEQRYCSEICPLSSFVYNTSCVVKCPETAMYLSNGHCVNRCPDDNPYEGQLRISEDRMKRCFKECPNPFMAHNFTCVDVCPLGMKSFERTCLSDCPNGTFVEYVEEIGGLGCVNECNRNVLENNICTDSCPSDAKYTYDSHCVAECPKQAPYVVQNSFACLKECPEEYKQNVFTKECVNNCPAETKVYGKSCLRECPNATLERMNSHTGEVTCVKTCDKFIENGTCVDSCRKYSVNKTCVEKCPRDYRIVFGDVCYANCPAGTCLTDDGLNCTNNCILDTKNNKLVYMCPKSASYIRKYMSKSRCVEACGKNEVLNDFTCINVTDCTRAVLSHGKCTHECPEGYLYMPKNSLKYASTVDGYEYKPEDAQEDPCVTVTRAYSSVVSVGIFTIIYTGCVCVFISTVKIDIKVCGRKKEQQSLTEEVIDEVSGVGSNVHLESGEDTQTTNVHDSCGQDDDEPLLRVTVHNEQAAENLDTALPYLAASNLNDDRNGRELEEYSMEVLSGADNNAGITEEIQEDVPLLSAT